MSATTTNSEDDWHVDILIIGVGAEGCAAIQMESIKELFSGKKNVHVCYIAIASDVQILEKCSMEQKILVPESSLACVDKVSTFIQHLPTPDMAFVITGAQHESDIVLSSVLAQHLRATAHSVMGMAISPVDDSQKHLDSLRHFISSTNVTHMLHQENIYVSMVKTFQCIIESFCVKGIICVDFEDICTVFGSKNSIVNETESLGLQAYMGYGVALGDGKSHRAECAAKNALQSIALPVGKTLKNCCSALYSIRGNPDDISGDEIYTIGKIIRDAVSDEINIIYTCPNLRENNVIEVQIIIVFDEKK